MANWQTVTGPWGSAVADVALANAWAAAARTASQSLRANPPPAWEGQKLALVSAWNSLGNAYRAANIPPPSDPRFRARLTEFYGQLAPLDNDASARLQLGPMVAPKLGGSLYARFRTLWESDMHKSAFSADNTLCVVPVRVCLTSNGTVSQVCLDATGEGDCSYRGLFTGCAAPNSSGRYAEQPCADDTYSWQTVEWYDPPGSPSCKISRANPPAVWSLDLLDAMLDDFEARGAIGVIETTRTFVAATNAANAIKAGLINADEYRDSAFQLQADADEISRGNNPTRATIVGAATTVAAIAAQAGGPYGAAIALVAAIVAAIASIYPVATGTAVDALGMPKVRDDLSAAWLASAIAMPNAQGVMALDVPMIAGAGVGRQTVALRGAVPIRGATTTATQIATRQGLGAPPTLTIVGQRPSQSNGGALLAAAAIAGIVIAGKKMRL